MHMGRVFLHRVQSSWVSGVRVAQKGQGVSGSSASVLSPFLGVRGRNEEKAWTQQGRR